MKHLFIIVTVSLMASMSMYAQDLQVIKLNNPDKTRGSAFMKALSDRESIREYDTKELSLQDLSDLLWAANGVNRPDGKRTAPSAMNRQEIDVYVINKDGAYLYNATENTLVPVAAGDFRKEVAAQQDFAATAPVSLVLVANLEKLGDPASENTRITGGIDAGIVSQNINIFCAAVGLATVPRGTMKGAELKAILKLSDSQRLMLNNPVGHPKK
jgi:SagB-type dehydrogenase family enzyme